MRRIRVRQFAMLRRSLRLKAKYAGMVKENEPSDSNTSPKGVVDIREVLQEINFLIQTIKFLDVETTSTPCLDTCSKLFSIVFGLFILLNLLTY